MVCGLDTQINYTKLSKAFQYLTRNPGCHFIATNEDSTFPSSAGLLPGAGSISAPLRYALGRDPVCTGKPAGTMLDCVKAKFVIKSSFSFDPILKRFVVRVHFDPKRTIMVGDRLNTDILFGQNGGLTTLLVLTGSYTVSMTQVDIDLSAFQLGITTEDEITGPNPSPIVPDFVTQTLGDFRIVEKAS